MVETSTSELLEKVEKTAYEYEKVCHGWRNRHNGRDMWSIVRRVYGDRAGVW